MIGASTSLRPLSPARLHSWKECASALIDKAADDAHRLVMSHDAYETVRGMGADSDRLGSAYDEIRQARAACRRTEKACHRLMGEIGGCYPKGTTPSDLPPYVQGIISMVLHAHGLIWNVGHLL